MPLSGGPSDKAGNSYERRLTVLALTDLLIGRAQSLRIEVPGEDGLGAEYRLVAGGVPEWYQAKRQRDAGPWTIANLAAADVLAPWWPKIQAGGQCVFVSSTGAQELRELVERAAGAASWDEFASEFLTGEHLRRFQRLRRAWGDPPDTAVFAALRQVEVRLIDEAQLGQWVEDRLRALVTGVPATAAAVLAQLVDDCVHRELVAADVWARLAEHGIAPRNFSHDAQVIHRLSEQVDAYLQQLRRLYIDGRELPRSEADEAFSRLVDERRVLLAGGAGSGKSVTTAQVVARARAQGWPVLVVSAERLSEVNTVYQLGEALGLPDSPTTVLAGIAAGGDALLVIDQLDALSVVSGRHPERLSVVTDLLSQAASYPRIRVMLACRRFDLDNDRALRAIAGEAESTVVPVGALAEPVVRQVLSDARVEANLPAAVMELLTVPLHLAIFVELAHAGVAGMSQVRSLTELYDRYWEVKRQACRTARGGKDDWLAVVDRLTDRMNDRQELTVPSALLDDLDEQARVMASNGVLLVDPGRAKFFHETFFDYCFARLFIMNGSSLRDLLTSTDQDLFRRAQVRQLLVYERSADRSRYLEDVAWLLSADEVRLHIKTLVIALFGLIADPTPAEWATIRPLVDDPASSLQLRCWQALRNNPAWFPVLQAADAWRSWLVSTDSAVVDRALWALAGMAGAHPAESTELVRGLRRDDRRPARLRGFLWMAAVHAGHVPLDLLTEALNDGLYDTGQPRDLWTVVHRLAAGTPAHAVDVIHLLLTRAMGQAQATGVNNPFKVSGPLLERADSEGRDSINAAANGAPAEFVERLLPAILEVMRRNARPHPRSGEGVADGVWALQTVDRHGDLDQDLFAGMEQALRLLAAADPDRAADAFATLQAAPLESAWFLLARGYLGNPQRFADDAANWLTRTPGALHLGYREAAHWVSRELIAAVSELCSEEQLDQLVDAILYYTPPNERTYHALKYRGWGELTLLNGVAPARRPVQAERRLAELRRKFGHDDASPPRPMEAFPVPAPIASDRAKKMTDDQWLRAIARHSSSEPSEWRDGRLLGDASTQAEVLAEIAKDQPERFARLFLRFPSGTAEPYVAAVLRGLTGLGLDPALLLQVCAHAQRISGNDPNRWIARLVESEAAATLPTEIIDIVTAIASTDPDPEDDVWLPSQPGATAFYGGDIDLAGLNCARGAAALALGTLVRENRTRLTATRDALTRVAVDPTLQVRAMAAAAFTSILDIDAHLALDLFRSAVTDATDELLASSHVERFLHYAVRTKHYTQLADILDRMANSPIDEVRQAGARQLTVASFADPTLDPRVDTALSADDATRLGVVGVFAANVIEPNRRERIFEVLTQSFADSSNQVRSRAARAFYGMDKQRLGDYTALLEAFAQSPSVGDNAGAALHLLDESRHPLPTAALDICERFVQIHGASIADISTSAAADARPIVQLVLRLHAQTKDADIRRRCLDMIDQLVTLGAYGIDDDLAAIER